MPMKATAVVDIAAKDKDSIAETLEKEPGVREYGFSDEGVYAVVIPNEVERKQLLKKVLAEHGYDDPDCERTEV
ncbi:hypothetical protein [Haloplanus aerogenes]|uniref:Uncharacterized protein n=1 Tax=Haloplanus aerogenes TaxID=660522 RepID=A0A3M0CRN3_9EURY|nr:hypothetical protein [Haloplanus aerogenes]AZH25949.1 hypothetical protein DU502_11455 [Haloplanus aerogenes]RMB11647.1 hypothetical protein ATH50_3345 [Haloplanus aerogenes]